MARPEADEMDQEMAKCLLGLIKTIGEQGHSGGSIGALLGMFETLSSFKPLTPLTGEDSEWLEVNDEGLLQNVRYGSVFKDSTGRAYDIDAKVLWEWYTDEDGERHKIYFHNSECREDIEFPYTPPRHPKKIFRPPEDT